MHDFSWLSNVVFVLVWVSLYLRFLKRRRSGGSLSAYIDALKQYRQKTGAGLKEAKAYVDRQAAMGAAPGAFSMPGVSGSREVSSGELIVLRGMISQGQQIEAMRYYREKTGASLKEAKAYVERLARG